MIRLGKIKNKSQKTVRRFGFSVSKSLLLINTRDLVKILTNGIDSNKTEPGWELMLKSLGVFNAENV